MNDPKMLYEHVEFHRLLGVEHFLIYDGTNAPPYPRDMFIGQNDVEIIECGKVDNNCNMYSCFFDASRYLENKTRWIIYNDTDEILVPVKTTDIKVMLQDYESFQQVSFNWLLFGSNKLEREPDNKSIFEIYTKRARDRDCENKNVKSISDPKNIVSITCSHYCNMKTDKVQQVNEHKEPISGIFNHRISHDIGYVAHYRYRARDCFEKIRNPRTTRPDDNKPFDAGHCGVWSKRYNDVEEFRVRDLYIKLTNQRG